MAPRYIDVTLDKPRKLRFDVNALDALERATGAPLGEMLGLLARGSLRCLRLAIWQGLRHEDPKLTTDKAGELIQLYLDRGGLPGELNDTVVEALYAAGILQRPGEADTAEDPPTAPTES